MAEFTQIHLDDAELQSYIKATVEMGKDPRKVFKRCGIIMYRSTGLTFRMQGRPERWEPMSDVTKEMRRQGRRRHSPMLLRDTGRMFASVTRRGAANSVYTLTPQFLELGTTVRYAPTHQWGRDPMPAVANIREHTRTQTHAWGRPIEPRKVTVRAHTRNVILPRIPQRMFLLFQDKDVINIKNEFIEAFTNPEGYQ
jgi:phage gpG-like protein